MALSIFDDKGKPPKPKDLQTALGRSHDSWESLTGWLADRFEPVVQEWNFAGKDWGWSMRLKHKKRAILYLTPQEKQFLVGLVLGEKAVAKALAMDLTVDVVKEIKTAKRYPEGRALRFEIRFKKDLQTIRKLAEAKMSP